MLFLVLATLSSSVLALVLKRLNSGNTYGVYFFNYVTCALLSFLTLEDKALWRGDPLPLWLGAVGGFVYPVSYTHLDVYKRQCASCAAPSCAPVPLGAAPGATLHSPASAGAKALQLGGCGHFFGVLLLHCGIFRGQRPIFPPGHFGLCAGL